METHQIWIDFALRLHHLGGPNMKRSGFDVLLWRPKKELDGKVDGGLDDPSYKMVYFKDWESFPYPEAEKPIAFLSSVRRPRELASVFESLESKEFPNWYKTGALFSVSFIDPGELRKKLAEVRMNPEETPETFWLLDTPREALEWMQKGHGLMGTYYDGNVWSAAAATLSPTASCRSCVLFTMPSSTIDFPSLQPRSSAEWQGFLQIDRSDEYVFATESSGGSAVYVDGRRVVDNWEPTRRTRTREGRLRLDNGLHALTIRYDGHPSGARLRFLWKTGGEPFSVVPAENLRIAK